MKTKIIAALLSCLLAGANSFATSADGGVNPAEESPRELPTDRSFDTLRARFERPFSKRDEADRRAIFAKLDSFDHRRRLENRYLHFRYRQDVLIRSLIAYLLDGDRRLESRQTAAWMLARVIYRALGDEGLLRLAKSFDPEIKHGAIDLIRARLSGVKGFVRAVRGQGAPDVYKNLDADEKYALALELLGSTGWIHLLPAFQSGKPLLAMSLPAVSAGMIESLGSREEIGSLGTIPFKTEQWDERAAAQRVFESPRQTAFNKCALLLQYLERHPPLRFAPAQDAEAL